MLAPSTAPRLLALSALLAFAGTGLRAQPCSISLGPDATICQGQAITLQGPPGYGSYLWSTGETTQDITVSATGNYWCQVSYPSGELVYNGSFSDGNTGFTTSFNYNSDLQPDGNYYIGFNAGSYHPFFVGWGAGLFMMGNGGTGQNGWNMWCQTVPVCPGQTYTLAFNGTSLVSQNPPRFRWRINGAAYGPTFIPPAGPNVWVSNTTAWTAPPGVTSADLCLQLVFSASVGNDWGIDDISFHGNIVLRDTVHVTVNPLPPVNLPPSQTICASQSLVLDATVAGGSYLWNDGSTGPTHPVTGTGTNSVQVTANGCTNSGSTTITVDPLPAIDLGPDLTLCTGSTALLDATWPGATYLWNDGTTAATHVVDAPGNFSVAVTAGSCTVGDAVNVAYNPTPVVDLGSDPVLCDGDLIFLDATVPGPATYSWMDGSSGPTHGVNAPGAYSVTVTVNGCSASDGVTATVNPVPTVDLGPDLSLCAGDNAVLDATTAGATYLWHDGTTAPTHAITATGTYSVTVTVGSCSASDQMNAVVSPLPVVDLGNDQQVCAGTTVLLDATTPNATYQWNTGAQTATIQSAQAGPYSVQVTVDGCTTTDQVNVAHLPLPVFDLGPDQTICAGTAANLGAPLPGATYAWSNGAVTPTIQPAAAGTYWVDATVNGCTARDSIDVLVTPIPVVDLGPQVNVCPGGTTTLDATMPNASYLWSNGAGTPTIVAGPGNYSVQVTQNGCTGSGSITVGTYPGAALDLGPDLTLCPGQLYTLDATQPGASYLWSDGSTGPTFLVDVPGAVGLQLTDANGCAVFDNLMVTYAEPAPIDLGPDAAICSGTSITLDATLTGATYAWNTGATTPTLTVSAAGSYHVLVTQGNCTVSDTIVISVAPTPQVELGPDIILCQGQSAVLDGTWPGASYAWSTGAQGASITVGTTGNYAVTVALGACTASDQVQVTVQQPPALDLGPDQTLCAGQQAFLSTGITGAAHLWSTGASGSSISAGTAGIYWVRVSQGACTVSDTVAITVVDPGSFDLGAPVTACEGETVLLDATLPGASYAWSNGAQSPTIAATTSGLYSVTATVGPCSFTDQVQITFNPLPQVDLGPVRSICPGGQASFDATSPGASYVWHDGSTLPTYTTGAAGPVSVVVTANGCSAASTSAVQVQPLPIVSLGNDTTLCAGQSLALNAAQAGATYLWSTGAISPSITVAAAGSYTVTVDLNGCTATDAIAVAVFDPATLNLGPDRTLCPGEAVSLATGISGTHLWSTGSNAASIDVGSAGTYWVAVQVGGCIARDTVTVQSVPLPLPDLGPDRTICRGDTLTLRVEPGAATVLWSSGSASDSIRVAAAGRYSVTLSLAGCIGTDDIRILVKDSISALAPWRDSTYCLEQPLVLDASVPDGIYAWSTGETGPSIAVRDAGIISVRVTGLCVDAAASIRVSEGECDPLIFVPNTFTPNGDGNNEVFRVSYTGPMRDFTLDIFDRWGLRVFHATAPTDAWDGTFGGQPVPDGVYVWKLRFRAATDNGRRAEERIGHVNVLR